VGAFVAGFVGATVVGPLVGAAVVGPLVGAAVVGPLVGATVVGAFVGATVVGAFVGAAVVGAFVRAAVVGGADCAATQSLGLFQILGGRDTQAAPGECGKAAGTVSATDQKVIPLREVCTAHPGHCALTIILCELRISHNLTSST